MNNNIREIKQLVFESLEVSNNEYKDEDILLKCPTWDSIGLLTIIANFKEKYNVTLDGKYINNLKTFGQIFNYIYNLIK